MRRFLTITAAILTVLALGSCGSSGPSTEEEVREAALKATETDDAKLFCRGMVSARYIERIFGGDVSKCVRSAGAVPKRPGRARVRAVVLDKRDESRAQVALAVKGGDLDGTGGHLEMVEEEDGWKLDEYEDDFLRSAFLAEIKTTDEGAVSTAPMKACFTRQVKTLDAATVRELTYASNSDRQADLDKGLLKIAENCPKALADYGAKELTRGIVKSGKRSPAFVHCLRREIRFLLELSEITPELLVEKPNMAAVWALEGIAEGAKQNCEST